MIVRHIFLSFVGILISFNCFAYKVKVQNLGEGEDWVAFVYHKTPNLVNGKKAIETYKKPGNDTTFIRNKINTGRFVVIIPFSAEVELEIPDYTINNSGISDWSKILITPKSNLKEARKYYSNGIEKVELGGIDFFLQDEFAPRESPVQENRLFKQPEAFFTILPYFKTPLNNKQPLYTEYPSGSEVVIVPYLSSEGKNVLDDRKNVFYHRLVKKDQMIDALKDWSGNLASFNKNKPIKDKKDLDIMKRINAYLKQVGIKQ